MFSPIEYDFKKTIENNLYTNLSISELAHLCSMSLSTFKRKFKATFSESPKQYLLKKKMEKARQLLQIKENRIIDVAFDCGFDSLSAFNRNFKTYFGQPPSVFRANANA